MTIVAVWCKHEGDNIIGIGPKIPWHISSDFKRFKRITEGATVVAGQTTYETFPNRTLPNRRICVLTFDAKYEVSDKENHVALTDMNMLSGAEDTLYVSGGASIYKAFMTNPDLMPTIVVDSTYLGALDPTLEGKKIDITPCIDVLKEKFTQISRDYMEDNIVTRVFVKKGDFIDQSVLKHIITAIENKGE